MIDLPDDIAARGATPRLMDFGGFLEPGLGGEVQRINRMGSRFSVAFEMPPLTNAKQGRIWVSRLIRAKSEGARWAYPLLDFNPGVPGAFVVNGAGQAGRTLQLRGGTPNYAFREGQPFSVVDGSGQHYLHFIDAQAIADAGGNVTITFSPMLRIQPANGAALKITQPMIEGYVMGDQLSWEIALDRTIGLSFEIAERR